MRNNFLTVICAILILAGCTTQNEPPTANLPKTEYQSISDKIGFIRSLDKENKTFDFIMLSEKQGQQNQVLKLRYDNPLLESKVSEEQFTLDNLNNFQTIRLNAISNGESYDATKIVVLNDSTRSADKNNLVKQAPSSIDKKAVAAIKSALGNILPPEFATWEWSSQGKSSVAGKKNVQTMTYKYKNWSILLTENPETDALYEASVYKDGKEIWFGSMSQDYKIKN